ncbi:hypothetical protein P9G84_31880 [Brevibacillus centrosporus]|uniref:phosphoadenosine phosphosulfate reductase domain-containing protein n=1 Tax=Brevibacillus centrosporus TaxID=54910 RepID=UPI000F09B1F7|nr:phosphoadenosine phosphosulfate reductase family protein [Brevibacillus centrosporus]MEC2133452.1 hypothetical protein [Brevibacillus centrosporus]RNB63169.1 hypothetical protein EDM55_29340 [Brevibacillus centrosporus]GED35009.1 hypothetical protein BCE02nite_61500 [Brevibacillus centrosporus]
MRNHIIFFSGGKSSFSVADWVKTNYPEDNIVLYFTDTLWENFDLYRFIDEASDKLELPMLTHSAGLNPVELMFEKKLVFNSMIGDCSKVLKMRVAADFLKKGKRPAIEKWRNKKHLKDEGFTTDATLYFGIGFEEMHRQGPIKKNWQPFQVEMPAIDHFIDNNEVLKRYGIRQPVMYDLGFSHNNCNGRCVKAGQGHYKNLKQKMPDVFRQIMEQEHHLKMCVSAYRYITDTKVPEADRIPPHVQEIMLQELDDAYRDYFYGRADKPKLYIHPAAGAIYEYAKIKQYSFMKKSSEPYPIRELHYDDEREPKQIDMFDIGGCGCFSDPDMNAEVCAI